MYGACDMDVGAAPPPPSGALWRLNEQTPVVCTLQAGSKNALGANGLECGSKLHSFECGSRAMPPSKYTYRFGASADLNAAQKQQKRGIKRAVLQEQVFVDLESPDWKRPKYSQENGQRPMSAAHPAQSKRCRDEDSAARKGMRVAAARGL